MESIMKSRSVFMSLVFFALILTDSCSDMNTEKSLKQVLHENPVLIGEWEGNGRFLDRKYAESIGNVSVSMSIDSHENINIQIGDLHLEDPHFYQAKHGYTVEGNLSLSTINGVNLGKKYGSILLVLPDESRDSVTTSNSNFHLSSNGVFDFSLIVGCVELSKHFNADSI